MLTVLSIVICVSLLVIAFGVFGVPYLLFGPAHVLRMMRQQEYRVFGGSLVTAALAVAFVPALAAGLISSPETAQVFADNMTGLQTLS